MILYIYIYTYSTKTSSFDIIYIINHLFRLYNVLKTVVSKFWSSGYTMFQSVIGFFFHPTINLVRCIFLEFYLCCINLLSFGSWKISSIFTVSTKFSWTPYRWPLYWHSLSGVGKSSSTLSPGPGRTSTNLIFTLFWLNFIPILPRLFSFHTHTYAHETLPYLCSCLWKFLKTPRKTTNQLFLTVCKSVYDEKTLLPYNPPGMTPYSIYSRV